MSAVEEPVSAVEEPVSAVEEPVPTSTSVAALTVRELVVDYGGAPIVDGVSLTAELGRVTVVIGPNGAGKSTLLKGAYGIVKPRAGTVLLGSGPSAREVTALAPYERTRAGMNYVPQTGNVFGNMSVRENLELGSGLPMRKMRAEVEKVLVIFPRIADKLRRRASVLSGGERQMVAIARAMLRSPSVLLLDEPTAGLSPAAIEDLFDCLGTIAAGGTTILMVEQNARRALAFADYAYVLDTGRNRFDGPGARVLEDPQIAELYLGARSGEGAVSPANPFATWRDTQ